MNNLSVYFLCQHHNQAHAQVQGGKSAQNSLRNAFLRVRDFKKHHTNPAFFLP